MPRKLAVTHGRPQLFWKGGGQDRARGRHLIAAYTLSTFSRFNQWGGGGGGGGGAVRFRSIQPLGGGGGCCPLSADSTSGGGGGGGGECCPLSADSTSGGRGGGGGGDAVRFRPIQPVGGGG